MVHCQADVSFGCCGDSGNCLPQALPWRDLPQTAGALDDPRLCRLEFIKLGPHSASAANTEHHWTQNRHVWRMTRRRNADLFRANPDPRDVVCFFLNKRFRDQQFRITARAVDQKTDFFVFC